VHPYNHPAVGPVEINQPGDEMYAEIDGKLQASIEVETGTASLDTHHGSTGEDSWTARLIHPAPFRRRQDNSA